MVSFTPMIDALFRRFGVAAEYYPQGGPMVPCTVIKLTPQIQGLIGSVPQFLSPDGQVVATLADVRRSDVETAKRGDAVVILAHAIAGLAIPEQPYDVIQPPELDGEKYVWTLPLREGTR